MVITKTNIGSSRNLTCPKKCSYLPDKIFTIFPREIGNKIVSVSFFTASRYYEVASSLAASSGLEQFSYSITWSVNKGSSIILVHLLAVPSTVVISFPPPLLLVPISPSSYPLALINK